ncbi:MAG: DMT family transporter, partial [Planctomycetota bacterium]|nr:DMT family transporter [Planctomycetota bacterium]
MTKTARAHTSMLLSAILVATSFPVVSSISGLLDSTVLTLLRFALASLIFFPLVALRYRREWIPSATSFFRYALLSAPLVGFFVAMFEALRTSNAINTGALFTLAPGFATVLAFFLLGERTSPLRLVALSLAMVGALWVVFQGDLNAVLDMDLVVGDAYFVAGTASLGVYVVLIKRIHRGEPMAIVTFWTLVSGTLWLSIFCW